MALMLSLHIVALSIWSAGLLSLAVLFAQDTARQGPRELQQQRILTGTIFLAISSPAAIVTIMTGTLLVYLTGARADWLAAKLLFVSLLAAYHVFCGHCLTQLGQSAHGQRATLRIWAVLVPFLLIVIILWLVLAKPALLNGFRP